MYPLLYFKMRDLETHVMNRFAGIGCIALSLEVLAVSFCQKSILPQREFD